MLILTWGTQDFNFLQSESNYCPLKISKIVWCRVRNAVYKTIAIKENQTSYSVASYLICKKALSSCMLYRTKGRLNCVKGALVVSPDFQLK